MLALNLDQVKISKNTKAHIWDRHKLTNKRVLNELTYGILDAMQEDEERMAIFTKRYFVLIIDINNNLVTAFQGSKREYKKYLKLFSK